MPEQETGEFQFQMDIWTRTPSTTLLQPKKKKMLIFGLCSTSGDWLGWSMDLNPIHHPSPGKKIKCSLAKLSARGSETLRSQVKMHRNCLKVPRYGFGACRIQWEWFQVDNFSSF